MDLDDPNIQKFEKRLIKNKNDYLDYISYLESKKTTPKNYIFFYSRLIIIYKNEDNVVLNLWKNYIEHYKITNQNLLTVVSAKFLKAILTNLSNASIISSLKYLETINQTMFMYYMVDIIMKLFNDRRITEICEDVFIKSDDSASKDYGMLKNFKMYLSVICDFPKFQISGEQKLKSKLLFKYLIIVSTSEENMNTPLSRKASAIESLKNLHDFDTLSLYFDKLEKDQLQFVYYAILKLLASKERPTDFKLITNKIGQLLSNGLKRSDNHDIIALKWLKSLVGRTDFDWQLLIDDLNQKITNSGSLDSLEVHYDILIQLLNCALIEDNTCTKWLKMLESAVNDFESKRIMCLLKENITNFKYWKYYLNYKKFDEQSLEFFLTTVEVNSNKTYLLNHVLPGELGNIWTAYAEFFSADINNYRTIIKCSLAMGYPHYQDIEIILLNWLSKEQSVGDDETFNKLLNKLIKYSSDVHGNDGITKTLKHSRKLWYYLLHESKGDFKVTAYTTMTKLTLITTDDVAYISEYVLLSLRNTKLFLDIWTEAFRDLFINLDQELQLLYTKFQSQLTNVDEFYRCTSSFQVLKWIINKVDNNKKEMWISKYIDMITQSEMEHSERVHALNKIIMQYLPILKGKYILEKWIEMISNININSLSTELISKIRFGDLNQILQAYNGLEIISSKLPSNLIAFESKFFNNEVRIRELYIYFAQLLPPNFNSDTIELWNDWQEFELKNGKLKDLVRWRKDITSVFQKMGYEQTLMQNKPETDTGDHVKFVKASNIKSEVDENILSVKKQD
ncbi:uncharacterized protein HGUI_01372 [Hanseniaspora guilliermondii]|uniref:Uncharacterized protein n=1 Tax=Hanseniaspora guilliermondii TaxID=56406 RepID=A0A1L0B050_9ASCO|nr:uncharacterized protein HGUI_01372 [Hanseniaspora guilliermondii]